MDQAKREAIEGNRSIKYAWRVWERKDIFNKPYSSLVYIPEGTTV